jgi:polar amino acid transport system ATP-binding protein
LAPSEARPPIVRLRGVTKRYGDLAVLDNLDLAVPPGQKLAIIGPSGAGKSTILRLVMTLERPDAGTLEIGGEPVWTMARKGRRVAADAAHVRRIRGRVGMVFQQFNLFPHMSVLRNVTEAPRCVRGLSRRDAERQARELLEVVGLADKIDAWPAQLSGGQQQRVAIARALALRPEVMLFDEVTSALDPELVEEVLNVLRKLAREENMTLLIVTHEIPFARDIADRVVFMEDGRIVEDGPPEVLFTRPEKERTRRFLKATLSPGTSRPAGNAPSIGP